MSQRTLRTFAAGVLCLAFGATSEAGGVLIDGRPSKLTLCNPVAGRFHLVLDSRPTKAKAASPAPCPRVTASLQVSALRWIDRDGRASVQPLSVPTSADVLPTLLPPAGEWVEVELVLAAPARLTGATDDGGFNLALDLPSLSVPLAEPIDGGQPVRLELSLTLPEEAISDLVNVRGDLHADDSMVTRLGALLADGALASPEE